MLENKPGLLSSKRAISRVSRVASHSILVLISISFILPFFWMISTSLKIPRQVMVFPPVWIPNPTAWQNYPDALDYMPFFTYAYNTTVYCVLTVLGVTLSCSLVAYGFSRIQWPGRDIFFVITLATMMLPYQVTLIPLYILFRSFGWVGSWKPLIVPAFFGNGFYIFLLRQFFMTIPFELSDAASIDGASELRIYSRLILPLSKPALAVVILFQFLFAWRDFLGPLIYLTDDSKYPLSLGLSSYLSVHGQPEWGLLMAAATMMTLPIVIIFFFAQRTFIQGIALTGLKG